MRHGGYYKAGREGVKKNLPAAPADTATDGARVALMSCEVGGANQKIHSATTQPKVMSLQPQSFLLELLQSFWHAASS